MVGRQVIKVKEPFTLAELEAFMQKNWNKEEFGVFTLGKPTSLSVEEYILLPATPRYLVIVYPRTGGIFSKGNKVILTTADTPEGANQAFLEYIPTRGPLTKLWQTKQVLSAEKERTGPAEETLQAYTAHMKEILAQNGLLIG